MLQHLTISNYALIESLEITPDKQLNVITGETGAGKSIMLGAVGLLLGNRAETQALLNKEVKCIVEGEFLIKEYNLEDYFKEEGLEYDPHTIIRREINPSGKSRAFVNDSPVTLDILKTLGQRLMDIHSQHENLELGKGIYQLNLIDSYANNKDLLEDYKEEYNTFRAAEKAYESLKVEAANLKQEADYNSFLLKEMEEADLSSIDQEEMESNLSTLENAEEIKSSFFQAHHLLSEDEFSSLNSLRQAQTLLRQVTKFNSSYKELFERLESSIIEIEDITKEIQDHQESVDFDEAEVNLLKERLSKLYQLQKKHGVDSVQDLLALESNLAEKVSITENLDEKIEEAERKLNEAHHNMEEEAEKLSESRLQIIGTLRDQLVGLLMKLGMPNAKVEISHEIKSHDFSGKDTFTILFSANKGIDPQPIQKIASGGEFSRLIFCIKYILAQKTSLPTVVFDEIDTGISGEIALKLSEMMRDMAEHHQVIVISHSPQVAAKANSQYFVYKDDEGSITTSRLRRLSEEERVIEIAKMIGGQNPAPVAIESARSLMN